MEKRHICGYVPNRLTIFLPSLAYGGAERAFTNIANGFVDRGVEVALVLAHAAGPYIDDISPAVRIFDLKRRSVAMAIPGLLRHLREYRPDALLSAMTHANVASAIAWRLANSSARLVLTEHTHLSSAFKEYRNASMRVIHCVMPLTYSLADHIIAVSNGVATDLKAKFHLNQEKLVGVYNPVVDTHLFHNALAPSCHPWLAQKKAPVVVTAGRLVRLKDFATLIRAFALVRSRRTLKLVIFGEGPLHGELIALARSLGVEQDVDLPGFVSNPFSEMSAADLFVLSSRYEGLSNVLIEAMACGTPVVSTDCPSGPYEILEGGRWGQLVPVGDSAAMARAIEATLDASTLPDVRVRAAEFSTDTAISRYAEVLGLAQHC